MAKRTVKKEGIPWTIYVGTKNTRTLTFTENDGSVKDLSGYTFYCQIREDFGGEIITDVDINTTNIAIGVILLVVGSVDSANVGLLAGVYDLLMEENAETDNVVMVFQGKVSFSPIVVQKGVSPS